jgi:hypothetical protein
MDQPPHVLVFGLGCAGAIAPEVVRLYKLRCKPLKKMPVSYYVISIIYAAFGGLVAVALPSVTVWAALYAGVTWPMLLSAGVKHRVRQTALANDEQDAELIKKLRRGRDFVKASDHTPSFFGSVIEAVRNHADGLFL